MNVDNKVKKDTTIIWGIMCLFPVISLVCMFLIPFETQRSIISLTLGDSVLENEKSKDIFMYTFLVSSTVLVVVSIIIKMVIMSNSKIINSDLSNDLKVQKWQISYILSYSFLNAIPIFGFYLHGFEVRPLSYIMSALTLILIGLLKPKTE